MTLFVSATTAAPAAGQITLFELFGDSPGDRFGSSVAGLGDVDGDGIADFAVGAVGDLEPGGTGTGSVGIFSGATGARIRIHYGTDGDEQLGNSVAGAGDVDGDGTPDVVVGAYRTADNDGRVRVFSGVDGALLHTFDALEPEDIFGYRVAAAGDIDRDGRADLLIGTSSAALGAWVYSGRTGGVLYRFGCCYTSGYGLAGARDVNGDDYPDVLVGAPFASTHDPSIGRVELFSGQDGSKIKDWVGTTAYGRLGSAVAILPDVDGDGHDDLAAGAPGNSFAGEVHVRSGGQGSLLFVSQGVSWGDRYGSAIAAGGDLDGDGVGDLVVGAPEADLPGGSVDIGFLRLVSGASGTAVLELWGDAIGQRLGEVLALAGDLTGDGYPEVIVGLPSDSTAHYWAGAVRVLDLFADCNGNGLHDRVELATGTEADCNMNGVPDSCDVAGGGSTDCDLDGIPDECAVPPPHLHVTSPVFAGLSASVGHTFTIAAAPVPAAEITLSFLAQGDLGAGTSFDEHVRVFLNGAELGRVYDALNVECVPVEDELIVSRLVWEANVSAGQDAVFELWPSNEVHGCIESFIQMTVDYEVPYPPPADCNGNGIPDTCDIAGPTSEDRDADLVPDECEFEAFCEPAINSTGQPALMHWAGSNSVVENDLVLIAYPLPGSTQGLFILSPDRDYLPLGDGFLCLGSATQGFINRLPARTSHATGTMVHVLDLSSPPDPSTVVMPGSRWAFSCWFRDPGAGGAGFNFSNGLEVLFQP